MIPRIILSQENISMEDLLSYIYTGSHRNCANSVITNKADVCGMQDTMAKDLARQGFVKILYTSDYYPSSGIAYNQSVDIKVVDKIKQALLKLDPQGKHKKRLYNWDKTEMPLGFIETHANDYKNLRDWSIRLGFIHDQVN